MTQKLGCTVTGLNGLVEPTAQLEIVATGSMWSEGPRWIPKRGCLRWSDIPNNRILEYHRASGKVTTYATDVEFTNGRALDRDGSIVQCSHGRRRIERDRDGIITPVVEQWHGVKLNSPK